MKKRIAIGVFFGILAGVIDLIPMIIKNLTLDAEFSAFSMWVVSGFFIAATDFKMPAIIKGIIISFLILLPCTFIIGWQNPVSLFPIFAMTFVLGGSLGFFINQTILKTI
jgi:hypothetical protein